MTEAVYKGLTRACTINHPNGVGVPPYISHGLYGAGLELTFYRWSHQIVGHSGGLTGFASEHFFLPAHGFGVVTMSNIKNGVVGNYIGEIIV